VTQGWSDSTSERHSCTRGWTHARLWRGATRTAEVAASAHAAVGASASALVAAYGAPRIVCARVLLLLVGNTLAWGVTLGRTDPEVRR
jgi:hypothetical protein